MDIVIFVTWIVGGMAFLILCLCYHQLTFDIMTLKQQLREHTHYPNGETGPWIPPTSQPHSDPTSGSESE